MRLTMREQEVLVALIECPDGDKAMAQRLCVEPPTVARHLTSLFRKTGTENRVQLMRWALRAAQRTIDKEQRMQNERWIVGYPSSRHGKYSIISSGGRVIAQQIPDLATAKEIVGMRGQVADLEELATTQSNKLLSHAAFVSTWNRKQTELRSERDDLAAKLEEANAELHDLRIRAGLR